MDLRQGGAEARAKAESGRGWYAVLARTGLAAMGLSFGLVGALAVKLALGEGGGATSRQGALQQLAHDPFGKPVLIALAAGFAAYALWRFVQAYAGREDRENGAARTWPKRAGLVVLGMVYAALAYSTVRIVTGPGAGQSQNVKAHRSTAMVLAWPGGRYIVGAAGAALVAVALWNLYAGLTRRFEDRWRTSHVAPAIRRFGARAGVVGHVARFVVFGLIGVFVVKAAVEYRPKDAIGLDGALQKLAQASYGPWLLGLTAVGLVAYGLYCLVDAWLRDVSANA
ncbi:MAG TPA: DUF1206 domain-containing protein [Gaiellaceae bacterium]|nr:DUF1206 domain-containing protein [Gaiellaceae bacterium]